MIEHLQAIVATLVPPSLLIVAVIRHALRTDVRLLGRRRIDSDRTRYVFAIHNAEEHPLTGRIAVHLEPVLEAGMFEEPPQLLCGPHVRGMSLNNEGLRRFEVITPRLRALSTWVIHCTTNGQEGDLRLTVKYETETNSDGKRHTRAQWIRLGSQEPQTHVTREVFWLLGGTLLAVLTYLIPIVSELSWPRAIGPWQHTIDGPLLLLMIVCSLLAFLLCRQPPGFIIMGHLGWLRYKGSPRVQPTDPEPPVPASSAIRQPL